MVKSISLVGIMELNVLYVYYEIDICVYIYHFVLDW